MRPRTPIFHVSNGRKGIRRLQTMDTSELFSLHEALIRVLDAGSGQNLQRADLLRSIIRVSEILQERVPGDASLQRVREKLREKLANTTAAIHRQAGSTRKIARRARRRK